jgi:NAD(P)-dependent dehydrogenase (short-subunit alcohol dehydrogenase family)
MQLKDKIIVVTGAASGIGKGLAKRFAAEGAKAVVCSDIDLEGAQATADEIGGIAIKTNVGKEEDIINLIDTVENDIGPIDLFCGNAGILVLGGPEASDADWQRAWDVNMMAHVWTARHLVPRMAARGGGYFLITASAAGVLNQVGAAPYAVTKAGAVAIAEWIAMSYGDQGIKVSALCPQAVRSEMTRGFEESVASLDGLLEPENVAEACVKAIEEETFIVLPHPEVLGYMQAKASNYDKWLGGMRKLNRIYAVTAPKR